MGFRIFVGNLNHQVGNPDLEQLFSPFGKVVDARVILDRETGKSRGFGFVEFEEESAGREALESLQGEDLMDHPLRLKEASPREVEDRPRGMPPGPGALPDRAGQRGEGLRKRSGPRKESRTEDWDRKPGSPPGRPPAKVRGGAHNRFVFENEEEEEEDIDLFVQDDSDFDYNLDGIEGVEIEGADLLPEEEEEEEGEEEESRS